MSNNNKVPLELIQPLNLIDMQLRDYQRYSNLREQLLHKLTENMRVTVPANVNTTDSAQPSIPGETITDETIKKIKQQLPSIKAEYQPVIGDYLELLIKEVEFLKLLISDMMTETDAYERGKRDGEEIGYTKGYEKGKEDGKKIYLYGMGRQLIKSEQLEFPQE